MALATLATYALAVELELREVMANWLAPYEKWQLDELPLTLAVLASGLAWYAFRRHNDAQAALRLREQAEARVSALLARNRELAQQLIAVQESERLALARELHDELGQRCTAIRAETAFIRHSVQNSVAAGLQLRERDGQQVSAPVNEQINRPVSDRDVKQGGEQGSEQGGEQDHDRAASRDASCDSASLLAAARRADTAAHCLYELLRGMLRRLRPANLDELGLQAALQELCEDWEERSGISCIFHHHGLALLPDQGRDALDIAIYRMAQEALTNVLRHAQANSVRVQLICRPSGDLRLCIQDDGCGMDLSAGRRGLGLLGVGERAAALGGELQLHSAPGAGLRLEVKLRVSRPNAPGAALASVPTMFVPHLPRREHGQMPEQMPGQARRQELAA